MTPQRREVQQACRDAVCAHRGGTVPGILEYLLERQVTQYVVAADILSV